MDLSTLPLVVLDVLLRCLTLQSLISISRTCRAFRNEANRLLYRHPANICGHLETRRHPECFFKRRVANRMRILEQSLSRYHTNAKFLCCHTSFSSKFLLSTWSQPPLVLTRLRLDVGWFTGSNETEISKCLTSKHPETRIEAISLHGSPDTGYIGLLRQLDSFGGLNSLHIQISSFHFSLDPDDIVAELNCPHLKELVLQFSDRLVYLGERLPALEVLVISPCSTSRVICG